MKSLSSRYFKKVMEEIRLKRNERAKRHRMKNPDRVRESHRVWNWNNRHPLQRVKTGAEIDIILGIKAVEKKLFEPNRPAPVKAVKSPIKLEGDSKRCQNCRIILSLAPNHDCLASLHFIKEYGHSNI